MHDGVATNHSVFVRLGGFHSMAEAIVVEDCAPEEIASHLCRESRAVEFEERRRDVALANRV